MAMTDSAETDSISRFSITCNGRVLETGAATLTEFLRELDIAENSVVAEHNGLIVDRADFRQRPLAPGDTVELVHFVGGG